VTVGFSLHLYPIRYEWGRLLRVVLAGVIAYAVSSWMVPRMRHPLFGLLLRGIVVVVTYASVLFVSGFFHAGELQALQDIRRRALQGRAVRAPEPEPTLEMAGEIVAIAPEPGVESLEATAASAPAPIVSESSRDSRY
jgi:hypothetical protein